MYKSKNGMTLLELIVGFGMFMLFLGFLFGLFVFGNKSWKQADTKLQGNREVMNTLEKMAKDISYSNEGSLSIMYYNSLGPVTVDAGTPPTAPYCAISFLTPYDLLGNFMKDTDENPVWQAYIIYYVNPTDGTIRRKRVNISPITSAAPIDNTLFQNSLTGNGKILAKEVKNFSVVDVTGATTNLTKEVSNPIYVRIYSEKISTRAEKPETFEAKRMMRMFN